MPLTIKAAGKKRGTKGLRVLKFWARTKCLACDSGHGLGTPIGITVEVPRKRRPTPALREDVRFVATELAAPQLRVSVSHVVLTPTGPAARSFMGEP